MNATDNIWSLYRITKYPLNLEDPIYREYPSLKHGVTSSVQHYAQMLRPVVEEIMAANPNYDSWMLTAPPFYGIPAAANLLCWDIYKHLNPVAKNISVLDLRKAPGDMVLENEKDFSIYHEYSNCSWEERLALKDKHSFLIHKEDINNSGIIFINDINVTGSSREYIAQAFATFYPGKINWLYIFDCDQLVGRTVPQLENEINNFTINTLQDFAALLARKDIRHTAKCISKLFTYTAAEIEQLLAILNPNQRSKLWDAVLDADIYNGGMFTEKMALLRAYCAA